MSGPSPGRAGRWQDWATCRTHLSRPRLARADLYAQPSSADGRNLMIAIGFEPIPPVSANSGATSAPGIAFRSTRQQFNRRGVLQMHGTSIPASMKTPIAHDHGPHRARRQRSDADDRDQVGGLPRRAGLPDRGGVRRQRPGGGALPRIRRHRAGRLSAGAVLRRVRQGRTSGRASPVPALAGFVQAGAGQRRLHQAQGLSKDLRPGAGPAGGFLGAFRRRDRWATTARSPFPISPIPRWCSTSSLAPTPSRSIAIPM